MSDLVNITSSKTVSSTALTAHVERLRAEWLAAHDAHMERGTEATYHAEAIAWDVYQTMQVKYGTR